MSRKTIIVLALFLILAWAGSAGAAYGVVELTGGGPQGEPGPRGERGLQGLQGAAGMPAPTPTPTPEWTGLTDCQKAWVWMVALDISIYSADNPIWMAIQEAYDGACSSPPGHRPLDSENPLLPPDPDNYWLTYE